MSLRDLTVQFNEKGFRDLQNKIERIDKNLKKPKTLKVAPSPDTLKNLKSMAVRIAAIAAPAYAVAKAVKFMTSYIDKAENVTLGMARAGGLSAETYQTMEYAAKQNGFAITDLEGAMVRLNKQAAKDGDMRSADERLMSIADQLMSIKDPGQRAAFAFEKLGQTGTKLIPFLQNGAAGVLALKNRLGDAIIPAEKLERALRFQDMRNRVNELSDAIKNNLADALLTSMEAGGSLENTLKDLNNIDLKPIINSLAGLMGMAVKALGKISEAMKAVQDARSLRTSAEIRFLKDEKEFLAAYRGQRSDIEKDWAKGMLPGMGILLGASDEEVMKYFRDKTSGHYLRQASKTVKEFSPGGTFAGDNITKSLYEEIKALAPYDNEARRLVEKYEAANPAEVKASETKEGSKPSQDPTLKGSQKTANYEDPLLKTVLHFKNEFIVFAQRLLATQNKLVHPASASSYISSIAGSTYNVTVQVQGGGSAEQTGRTVGNEVIEILRKMHRDTTRAVNDHKTAVVTEIKKLTAGEITLASGPAPAPKTTEAG